MQNELVPQQPKDLAVFDKMKAAVNIFLKPVFAMKVENEESCTQVTMAAKEIKVRFDQIEAQRKAMVDPLNAEVKRINAVAKGIQSELEKGKLHCTGQLSAWSRILEQRRAEELKKAEDERRQKEEEARAQAAREVAPAADDDDWSDMFTPEPEKLLEQETKKAEADRKMADIAQEHKAKVKAAEANKVSGERKVWTFEVTDFDQVPREFMVIDEKVVRQAIRDGKREIPGFRIFQETQIAVR